MKPGGRSCNSSTPEQEKRSESAIRDWIKKSPFYRHMGLEVVGLGHGWATFRMRAGSRFTRPDGTMQSGAIASLADAAAASALATLMEGDRERSVTIELKLNFCVSPERGPLRARGSVVQKGKKIAVCEVNVTDDEGNLVAKGISTHVMAEE